MIRFLLYKDYVMLRSILPLFLLCLVVAGLVAAYYGHGGLIALFLGFWMPIVFMMILCQNDDSTSFEKRYQLLPISISAIVLGRFLSLFLLTLLVWLSAYVLIAFFHFLFGFSFSLFPMVALQHSSVSWLKWKFFLVLVLLGVYQLFFYRFGYLRYFPLFLFLLVPLLTYLLHLGTFVDVVIFLLSVYQWLDEQPVFVLLLSLLIYMFFYFLSVRAYRIRLRKG